MPRVSPSLLVAASLLVCSTARPARAGDGAPPPQPADAPSPSEAPRLTLSVSADRAAGPWTVRVKNEGAEPVRLAADSRLLSFEVMAPGAKKPVRCALPADARPSSDRERELVLLPHRSWSRAVDPGFFCFGAKEAAALVAGATVRATLGFDAPRAARGAKSRAPKPPFVASMLPGAGAAAGTKRLEAEALTLPEPPPATSKSDEGAKPEAPKSEAETRVDLTVSARIDAAFGREVSATVTLKNRDSAALTTLFRPSTVGFEVHGPDGVVTCTQRIVRGSPIAELFSSVGAGASASLTMHVDATCPSDTFARAGVYDVFALFDASGASGTALGLRSFDGTVRSREPARVRIRRSSAAATEPPPKLDP